MVTPSTSEIHSLFGRIPHRDIMMPALMIAIAWTQCPTGPPTAEAAEPISSSYRRHPITRLKPGTAVSKLAESSAWNRKVLVATAKINSGDVDAVSETVRDAAVACSLTILARVRRSDSPDRHYRLEDVGVGYSVPAKLGRVIVSGNSTSESNDEGAALGFIARQVLRTNETQLSRVIVVGKSDLALAFDAPSILHRRGQHRHYLTRHLVSIDRQTGVGQLSLWLLVPPNAEPVSGQNSEAGTQSEAVVSRHAVINHPIRVCRWNLDETRNIHVDDDQFNFLGVPGERAFALEDLPPGKELRWTPELARSAGQHTYSATELNRLAASVRQASR